MVRNISNETEKDGRRLVNTEFKTTAVPKDLIEISWTVLQKDYMSLSQPFLYSSVKEDITEILRDLGMTLIKLPKEILESIKNAGLNVESLAPKGIVSFLKTYRRNGNDGCVFSQINVPVSDTPFKSAKRVLTLLEYFEVSELEICQDFENCPLIISADGFIREFSNHKKLYLVQFPTLFPKSAGKFVHQELCSFFSKSEYFVDFVENPELEEIYKQVCISVEDIFCVGDIKQWQNNKHELPNEEWISNFWSQISKLFKDRYKRADKELNEKLFESKSNEERSEITKCRENLKRNMLESFCTDLLNRMGNFSCIPVCIKEGKKCKHFLYPLKNCNAVLFVIETYREENEILTSMKVPVIHSKCLSIKWNYLSNILKTLMANFDDSVSILNCIHTNKNELQVYYPACHSLLNYFQTHVKQLLGDRTNKSKLLCLPIFQAVSDKVVAVNNRRAVILPEEIPEEGLSDWGEKKGIVFVLNNRHFQRLYNYLGFHEIDKYGVYIEYILPSFKSLPHDDVIQHMKFIRDNLLPALLNNEDMKCKLDEVRNLLHEIAFLRMADETYVRPCKLYNRHAELFMLENQLCSESELPPEPYHTKEWEKFLIFCGMKNDLTTEVFCDFASRLQALGNENGMNNIVQKNSHRLIEILKKTPDLLKDHDFINKMKHIRFLCPQHTDGLCKMLLPEASSNEKLIAYNNSTYSHNLYLVWSEMNVLCENADPFCNQENFEASKLLGISDPPPLQTVVAHIESLCNSIQSNFGENVCQESDVEEKFAKIMEKIYKYLEKCGTTWSEKMLHQVPFIFLRESKILVTADRVVLRLRDEDEIIPYICKPSAHFGQFHTLLEKYGSHVRVKSSHCASILKTIHQESGGHILEPSDIARVQKAIRLLFQTIKNEKDVDLNVTDLFLLSTKNRLEDSRAMVFVDNVHLEKRIGENKLKYECFVGFKSLSMNVMDQMTEIKYLPERFRPLLLSDLIQEDLTVESKHTVLNSDSSQHLQRFLHSAEFFVGICRLILQECMENETSFCQEEQINVQTKLRAIHVEQVEDLKTVLKYRYEDSVLPKTEEDTSIFTKMDCGDEASLFLYFKMGMGMDMDLWIADNAVLLSKTLNRYLNKLLGNQTICLPSILGCVSNSHSIPSVLDRLKIAQIDVKIPTIASFMPELGAEIPVSCHYLVNNLCALIDESEYIAYELFDPIVDEDDPGVCNSTPVYIFAKAVERLSRSSSQTAKASDWQIRYKINVGGQIIISEASRVYRFVGNERKNEEGCDDVDDTTEVKKGDDQEKIYIRDVMKNAIKKSKAEFRRIFKRLYLQYHPDEHIDNKDYFHQLIQFICFIQLKLENKDSVENADILTSFKRNEEHNVIPVLERICSVRLNEYRKNRKECQEKQEKTLLFEIFRERGPQPGQSRRWFRQAETDFKAASTDEYEPSTYNWACYKCHQAVEKALKALQYQLDADKVSLNIHSLSILASPIADVKLSGLVGQLEGITGDYFCMRYPGVIHGGCISSDLYTEDQAKRAIERTGEILQIVRERLRSS